MQMHLEGHAGARWAPLHTLVTKVGNLSNVRTVTGLDDASIDDLANQIAAAKRIEVPLIVQRVEYAGKVYDFLWDGQRRHLALEHLLAKKKIDKDFLVPVIDRTPEPVDAEDPGFVSEVITSQLRIALDREGLSTYELCAAGAQLLAAKRKQAEVAKTLGKSETWVSRMMAAWKTSTDDLKTALRENRITDEQFKDLATVKEPERQVEATKEFVELREKNDRTSRGEAAALSKVIAEQERAKAKPAKAPAKATKAKKPAKESKAAPAAKAKEPPTRHRPSHAEISSIAKLRTERSGAKHAYVRGIVDLAAVMTGEITMDELKGPWKAYVKALHKSSGGK